MRHIQNISPSSIHYLMVPCVQQLTLPTWGWRRRILPCGIELTTYSVSFVHLTCIYCLLTFTDRTQLITALNSKPQHANSNIHQAQGLPISRPPRVTLWKSDYPNVKHWERWQNDAVQFAIIKVYNADSSDSDSDSRESGGITKRESGVLAFLEDENGKVIDHHERKWLYAELRGFWNDNIDSNSPPDNWSSAGATIRDKFWDILEEKFPFLRLCTGRWKVEALWKKNYHSWKRSLVARQARKTAFSTSDSDGNSKQKRKETSELMNIRNDTELSLDAPQIKKARTGTASIPSVSQSRKVC